MMAIHCYSNSLFSYSQYVEQTPCKHIRLRRAAEIEYLKYMRVKNALVGAEADHLCSEIRDAWMLRL